MGDEYCKFYLDFKDDEFLLIELIEKFSEFQKANSSSIELKHFEIFIRKNDEFINGDKDFLFYKFILDIEKDSLSSIDQFIASISNLLIYFWSLKIPCIASCTFEEKLINNGGYCLDTEPWK
ncbi:MAG: hypothetical protein R2774_01565 [Saprospiraceae bacterium]